VRLVAIAVVALVAGCQSPRSVVTARDLVAAPERHAEQDVVIAGTVEDPRRRMPTNADTYTSFTLADGTAHLPVVAWGTQPVGSGDLVEVRGVFHDRMRIGNDVVDRVIEAKFVRVLQGAVQPPGSPAGPS